MSGWVGEYMWMDGWIFTGLHKHHAKIIEMSIESN